MALERASPNFGPRKRSGHQDAVRLLVIHYTGMKTCADALDRLCDPSAEVSAHYLIDEDGTLYSLVAEDQRAWHAGRAFWHGISDVNTASIGIELVNPGHEWGYRAFQKAQISKLIDLCTSLSRTYDIPRWGVVGHSDVAPGRKTDPGELFPWADLASAGLGLWPEEINGPLSTDPWKDLVTIGYASPSDFAQGSHILDQETAETDVITAFQRHFLPDGMTGQLDDRTLMRIYSVAAQIT